MELASGWPAVDTERCLWQPSPAAPRSQQRKQRGEYHPAVTPRIAELPVPVEAATAALLADAAAEVARFDERHGATLAPYGSVLLRSESAASSRIERLTASARAIALAELGDPSRHNAAVIVANTRAMQRAIALADDLSAGAILEMHAVLLGDSEPGWVGCWRDQQVWIGGSAYGPRGALFVPPRHELVPAAIDDLVVFMARVDVPALTLAAVAHAQFETIHPFPDGNGRTGRALLHALLRATGLTEHVTVPISAGLLAATGDYFAALDAYRAGDLEPILRQVAEAAFRGVDNGTQLCRELDELRAAWADRITARRGAAAWRLAELVVRRPVVDSGLVQHELSVAAANANHAIDQLVDAGLLVQVAGQHRNRKWAAVEVLAALDDFAERAGRRRAAAP